MDEVSELYLDGSHSIPANQKAVSVDHSYEVANSCCRICLQAFKNKRRTTKPVSDKLVDCFPFMENFVTNKHFICQECYQKIKLCHNFKQTCLKAKEVFISEEITVKVDSNSLYDLEQEQHENIPENMVVEVEFVSASDEEEEDNSVEHIFVDTNDYDPDMINVNEIKEEKEETENLEEPVQIAETLDKISEIKTEILQYYDIEENESKSDLNVQEELKIIQKMEEYKKLLIQCPKCSKDLLIDVFLFTHLKKCELIPNTASLLESCRFCKLVLIGTNMEVHFQKDHEKYYCKTCDKLFITRKMKEEHLKEKHRTWCSICNRWQVSENFLQHLNRHNRYVKDRKAVLELSKLHNLALTEEKKPVVCFLCGKHVKQLSQHLRLHNKPELVECPKCDIKLKKTSLRSHLKSAHGPKAYTCEVCGNSFSKRANMLNHLETHNENRQKNVQCQICDMKFYKKLHLYYHNLHKHTFAYTCDICGRKFNKQDVYDKHEAKGNCKKVDHREKWNRRCEKMQEVECPMCGKVFKNKVCMKPHLERHNSQPVDCKICGKILENKYLVQYHMNKHMKKFACELCDFYCGRKGNLIRHMKTHTKSEQNEASKEQLKMDDSDDSNGSLDMADEPLNLANEPLNMADESLNMAGDSLNLADEPVNIGDSEGDSESDSDTRDE